MMKKYLMLIAVVALFVGCNASENKEGRIQKLESEVKSTTSKIQEMEARIQTLESAGKESEK